MDYEKLHKDTLAGLQRLVAEGRITEETAKSICADFVAENEDERIRKELRDLLVNCCEADRKFPHLLAWIEKQQEQKPLPGFDDLTPEEKMNHPLYLEGFDTGREVGRVEAEQKPAEWSEEDEEHLDSIIESYRFLLQDYKACHDVDYIPYNSDTVRRNVVDDIAFLKSLRPQSKREDEPMEIKFAGKIYKVHGKKDMPGGAIGYIIEDEPGHYDCIINPDEVLGGGYGIKGCGSPYPTKEANFGQPHWKPNASQMAALKDAFEKRRAFHNGSTTGDFDFMNLGQLYDDLKKLM